jgi:hypothetical protein
MFIQRKDKECFQDMIFCLQPIETLFSWSKQEVEAHASFEQELTQGEGECEFQELGSQPFAISRKLSTLN